MEQVFNKLVRDNIPKKIEDNGEVAITRVLDEDEYRSELYKKLLEEAHEVVESSDSKSTIEELADVLEVVVAIAELEDKKMRMKREEKRIELMNFSLIYKIKMISKEEIENNINTEWKIDEF